MSSMFAVIPIGYNATQNMSIKSTETDVTDFQFKPKWPKYIANGITNPHVLAPNNPVNERAILRLDPTPIAAPKVTTKIANVNKIRIFFSFAPVGRWVP